jgi:hypothetical protein
MGRTMRARSRKAFLLSFKKKGNIIIKVTEMIINGMLVAQSFNIQYIIAHKEPGLSV